MIEKHTAWRTASYSQNQGGCVEVRAAWRISSYCQNQGGCVEVGATVSSVSVRDSKDRGEPALAFRSDEWARFADAVRRGDFESSRN